ncbi:nicotinamide mononucleotide transporter [Chitinivorax tropicus]|uniref:Nicotinamide riboside transporter PnuC n=1 Tax=Chitinivorax tropicus TaxID=714531 RepID=A0A840MLN6_9PROT|nr:nicotinamide riboside transporter PnuC [Chitinivorax tropicus]MBB5017622.1 nicotinamide mononucleotide transporter [Chitinivorax tropicus]
MFQMMFDWLNMPALVAWGAPMSWAEVLGFVTGIACVALVWRQNIWNYPIGIANSALLLMLFVDARLFADAILQILFIALGLRGWWEWLHGIHGEGPLQVARAGHRELWLAALIGLALQAVMWPALWYVKGGAPFLDALVTSLSLVAQGLMNRKRLESWLVWVVVDLVSIPLYVSKDLYLVALLYGLFLVMACHGFVVWRRALGDQQESGLVLEPADGQA